MAKSKIFLLTVLAVVLIFSGNALAKPKKLLPIPDKLVVLTFDDGNKSDYTFTAPLLKKYGFGATFYIMTGSFLGKPGEDNRLSWEQIRELDRQGFEIGNHTRGHPAVVALSKEAIIAEARGCEQDFAKHGVPKPTTLAYPCGHHDKVAVEALDVLGYLFARCGVGPVYPIFGTGSHGPVYEPAVEHPLLVPSTLVPGPNTDLQDLIKAVEQARDGKITILTFHGIPDEFPWCSNTPEKFEQHMKYLYDNGYKVIALRDLAKYVDPGKKPKDPYEATKTRLGITPVELKCEYAFDPLGVDTTEPRFSWILESIRRDQKQSAYQILVASSTEKLKKNIGDLWDSGKVLSDKSVNVAYKGRPLSSGEKYFWKVRCWNKPGYDGVWVSEDSTEKEVLELMPREIPSRYTATATFEMGLLKKTDWQGKWIGADASISSPLLRKEFRLKKEIKSARAYISGIGWNEFHINGKRVGDNVLDPASSYYHKSVLYSTYDVTGLLSNGSNALCVMLGNGWYDVESTSKHRGAYGDRPKLILQMNIIFADESTATIVTDQTWKTSQGPIIANEICQGEVYDARLEKPGWQKSGYDDSAWNKALLVEAPAGKLVSQMIPPVKVIKNIKPVKIITSSKGVYIFDFGQHFSGWTQLKVNGPKGTKVKLRYAGRIYDDRSLDVRNNLDAEQTDTYILKGNDTEIWEPRFSLHGFRYVEVTGLPGTPSMETLQGRFVRSSVEVTGNFKCSNALINQIHKNVVWTFASSFQGIPQDAAERYERFAWLGDPGFIVEDCIYNFDLASFWAKWLNDIRDTQKPDGDIPVVSPKCSEFYAMWPCWKSTYPLITWQVYQYYSDERILAEHYEGMKKLVDFFERNSTGDLLPIGLGDHMEPGPDGKSNFAPQRTPPELTSTAYYYFDTWILAQAAKITGRDNDYKHYSALAEKIKEAFNREFFNKETNQYATGSQTANALALHLGMVPEERQKAVIKNLVDDIVINHKGHLSTGIIGANALEQALPEHGAADVFYRIATRTTWPSLGYQVKKGATTIWETWEVNETHSLNMKMLASVEKFFYKDLAGLNPAGAGYKEITIKPQIVGDLTNASASVKTVRGMAAVDWKKDDNSFDMKVTIPVNSTAKVSIPTMALKNIEITENGTIIWKEGKFTKGAAGIIDAGKTDDYITFNVGSGTYAFKLTGQN